jgi:DNA-directed RNA polymerase subunit RPC12/RpoP
MARGFRGGSGRALAVACLLERDGDRCWYCGFRFGDADRRCTVDHVRPVSLGGTNDLANLRLACTYCNGRRARFPDGEYERSGLLAQRRRLAYRDAMIEVGAWLPKRAFHHDGIRWHGERRWSCDHCRQRSLDGTVSPATVPCGTWALSPRASWVRWWRDGQPVADASVASD